MYTRFLFVTILLSMTALSESYGQLLQDRNKLKTEKVKGGGGGFLFFRSKVKSKSDAGAGKVENGRAPRFSRFSGAGRPIIISPKYSKDNAGQGGYRAFAPRYSKGPGKRRIIIVNPKYTKPRGKERVIQVNPRYSQGSNVYNYTLRTPKTASDQGMVFDFPKAQRFTSRKRNYGESDWVGPAVKVDANKRNRGQSEWEGPSIKVSSWKGRRYHPSSSYLMAKGTNSKLIRDGMRKFNILWNRVNGNKSKPKGVDKKSGKAKYDKDESEIWNNKEREYIKN